jgi:hypothetical protein
MVTFTHPNRAIAGPKLVVGGKSATPPGKLQEMNTLSSEVPNMSGVIANGAAGAMLEPASPNAASAVQALSAPLEQNAPSATTASPDTTADIGPEVDARTRANRANAQKSTGAKTPEGKAVTSQNALKHGLFAEDLSKYFKGEEGERYQRFITGIVADLRPVGDMETTVARRAADIQFRLEMLRTAEFQLYSGAGSAPQTMAAFIGEHRDPMGLVSLYDSRFQRSFKVTMEELRRLQQARRDLEKNAVNDLKGIAAAHIHQNATFDPAQVGSVLSRDFLFTQARLEKAKYLAQHCNGNGIAEKKVVDCIAATRKTAA